MAFLHGVRRYRRAVLRRPHRSSSPTNRTHVLIVCNYLPPNPGGIEIVVHNLALAYQNLGLDVLVTGFQRVADDSLQPYPVRQLLGVNPLESHGVPVPLIEPFSSGWRVWHAIGQSTAVHVHGLPYPSSVLTLLLGRLRRRRVVVTEHVGSVRLERSELNVLQSFALRVSGWIASRCAQSVVVLNDRVRSEVEPLVRPVPVVKISNGTDLELFHPSSDEARASCRERWGVTAPTVLFVGRDVPKKGLDLVIEAVTADDGVALLAAGSGTERVSDAGTRFRGLGPVDQSTIGELYQAVDLLVLPSEGEGLPLVAQEALASGLPVVLGEDPALERELPHGVVFTPRTAAGVAETIHRILNDASELQRLREGAERFRAEQAGWTGAAVKYLHLMRIQPADALFRDGPMGPT